MIVCNSNSQAKKIQSWFEKTKIKTKIIISDEDIDSEDNKKNQTAFKDSKNGIDMLIVHLMLTTGYDADRLKKLYLLRKPKEHSLLQTISRVNRPYKNKQGNSYKYGYITDFVDITEEYDRTVQAYLKELEDELDLDEGSSVKTLLVDTNLIQEKYEKALNQLQFPFLEVTQLNLKLHQ
jgi:type I restriction enzyme R subunit